jgi:hypothetical protein
MYVSYIKLMPLRIQKPAQKAIIACKQCAFRA